MRSTTSTLGLAVTAGLALATVAPLAATAAPQAPAPTPGPLGTLPATPRPATPDFDSAPASTRYVSVPVANVRKSPSMDADVVGSMRQGERVTGPVVNGWVKMGEGRYIGTSVTSTTPGGGGDDAPEPTRPGVTVRLVSVHTANVRGATGLDKPVVDQLREGQRVSGRWTGTGWLKIGDGRYMHHSVLESPWGDPSPEPDPAPPSEQVTRYVDVAVANVRSGPGLEHRVVSTLRSGAKVEGTKVGGWIRMSDGRYISETVLRSGSGDTPPAPAPPETQPTRGYVEPTRANVRSGPGLQHGVVGTLAQGTEVKGSLSNGWVKMSDGRFISTSVLTQDPPGGGGGGGEEGEITGSDVLEEAAKYAGIMYVWGGTTPEGGFDCSGYTGYVFKQLGIDLPRTAAQQRAHVRPVSVPKPGDLVFWGYTNHVAIYAGDGYIWDSGRPGLPVQKRKIFSGVTGYGAVEGVVN